MKKYTYKDLSDGQFIMHIDNIPSAQRIIDKCPKKNKLSPYITQPYNYLWYENGVLSYGTSYNHALGLPIIPASEVSLEDETMKPRKFRHRTYSDIIFTNLLDKNIYSSPFSRVKYSLKQALNATELVEITDEDEFVLPEKYYVHFETLEEISEYEKYWQNKFSQEYGVSKNTSSYFYVNTYCSGFYGGNVQDHLDKSYPIFKYKDIKQLLTMENKEGKIDFTKKDRPTDNSTLHWEDGQREIIGRKCPMDLYGGDIKIGSIIKGKDVNGDYVHNYQSLPKEIVETWEPVYKEEKQLPVIGGKWKGKSKLDEESGHGVIIYGYQDQIVHTYKEVKEIYENLKSANVLSFEHASGETVTINEVLQIVEYINSKSK